MDRPRRSDCTAGQMDGEAGWWTTSGNIRLPPLARVMGVGRQQQQQFNYKTNETIITALILSKENNYNTKKTHRLTHNSCTKVFITT